MTDNPDKWPVAAVLVWIATRDHAAFRIPAGKAQPNAPASCIFDRSTVSNGGSGGTCPKAFFDTAPPAPIPLAEHYIRVFRHGSARKLRPAEEVAQAAEELLARLNDGCLSAWQGETELTALTWNNTSVMFDGETEDGYGCRCIAITADKFFTRSRRGIYFKCADVLRVWPLASSKLEKLTDREQAARDSLKDWMPRAGVKDPYWGAWLATVRHVAKTCGCTEEAAKKDVGSFITDEINRLRKASGKAA
jgi:hypothetical protein